MFSTNINLKVFVATAPCDMRKSFDGLLQVVEQRLKDNPMSGAIFVFMNKKRSIMKALYWDGTGLWVLAKRLEQGTFNALISAKDDSEVISITPQAYELFTQGVELKGAMTRAWYEAP